MKKTKHIILTASIFLALAAALFGSSVVLSTAATPNATFNVYLTLSNNAPVITWVNASVSENPVEEGVRVVYIQFNVTDINGVDDLNDATATLLVNRTGETTRSNTSCTPQGNSGQTETYVCAINMQYYDLDGSWTINASIEDNSGVYTENKSEFFTYGQLKALVVDTRDLNFSNVALGQTVAADRNPLQMDNTGNQDISEINLTGYSLLKGAEFINASAFTVNVTDGSGAGTALVNGSMVVIANANLPRDPSGSDSNETLYFYVDVPSSGLTQGTFNASNPWELYVN